MSDDARDAAADLLRALVRRRRWNAAVFATPFAVAGAAWVLLQLGLEDLVVPLVVVGCAVLLVVVAMAIEAGLAFQRAAKALLRRAAG